jgi:hypothetical protein
MKKFFLIVLCSLASLALGAGNPPVNPNMIYTCQLQTFTATVAPYWSSPYSLTFAAGSNPSLGWTWQFYNPYTNLYAVTIQLGVSITASNNGITLYPGDTWTTPFSLGTGINAYFVSTSYTSQTVAGKAFHP